MYCECFSAEELSKLESFTFEFDNLGGKSDRNLIARDTHNNQSEDIFKIFSEVESQNERVTCFNE